MKRILDDSTNPDNRNLLPKKRRISENCNQDININNCKYWKLKNSYTANGYWSIFKLCLSIKRDRIGVVLSRKANNKFKIMIIETNIMNSQHKEIWSEEGIISSPNQIALNDKLNVCIVAYQCNAIDLFKITNSQSISKESIAINGKPSDPNISLIGTLINKIILITKRGLFHPRITEYDTKTGKKSEYELTNTINAICGNDNGSKYILLPQSKKANQNQIIIHDNDNNTIYDIKHDLETLQILKSTGFESLFADKYLKRIILKSNDAMYCLQIGKKTEVENINLQQHNDGSTSFDVNGVNDSPKTFICHSTFLFKELTPSHCKIGNFYNSDILIGHNQNQLVIWRICNRQQTKKVLLRSASMFDELICGKISEYISQIPQKFVITFIDCNKRQFSVEGLDASHGFIMLSNDAAESFAFVFDYSLILNLANQSQCFRMFTISLPKK